MKRIVFGFFAIILLNACSDTESNSTPLPDANFYALTLGNSWVYKNYKYDPGSETYQDTGVIDSVSVVGLEDISGVKYFKMRRMTIGNEAGITFCNPNGEHFEYVRDDNGNLTTIDGHVKFSHTDASLRTIAAYEWGTIVEQLMEGTTELSVTSGVFDCMKSERYAILSNGDIAPGVDSFYYADGYGLIYDTSSTVTNEIPSIIRYLDSYNVQ
ncbi:MAG: hypothetical protein GYB32_04810 [Algicola sp.]|nr:hypothetical protein [Algicola sp.]